MTDYFNLTALLILYKLDENTLYGKELKLILIESLLVDTRDN